MSSPLCARTGLYKPLSTLSFELLARFKRDIRTQLGALKAERIGVAPLMAGQMPVVVVPGGEFAVANHDRRHARS